MIISQTPMRISFLGGGTDYPEYFLEHGGAVLGTSIDKYSYITANALYDLFDWKFRISYTRTELTQVLDEIVHPAVRECLRFVGIDSLMEIHYIGDLPSRTGLGTSSSFTVGLLRALYSLRGKSVSNEQIAREAVYIERERIKERVGLQDQYFAALGGLLFMEFNGHADVRVTRVSISPERKKTLESNLMLFYTGMTRTAHEVVEEQINDIPNHVHSLKELKELAMYGYQILTDQESLVTFGKLLHEGWKIKKSFSSKITNSVIDSIYDAAVEAGAVGGKLLGAGAGGFLLFYVEPEFQDRVREKLSGLKRVPFCFEDQGSKIIVNHEQYIQDFRANPAALPV